MMSNVNSESKEIILLGDINANYLKEDDHKQLKSIIKTNGLKQLVKEPTRITDESKTLIDVVCSNAPQRISDIKIIPSTLSDHDLIGCVRKMHHIKYEPKIIKCRNYTNYNPDAFCDDIRNHDFTNLYQSSCPNTTWSLLKSTLHSAINKHAPQMTKKVKSRWLDQPLKKEMNDRDRLLRKSRKSKLAYDKREYKNQRNRVNKLVKAAKSHYYKTLLNENKNSCDKFWSVIKSIFPTKDCSKNGKRFDINGDISSDKHAIANSFCNYFSTVAYTVKSKCIFLRDFVWHNPTWIRRKCAWSVSFNFKPVTTHGL